MPLVRGASRRGVGRRARFMQRLAKLHGATRTKSTSLLHAVSSRGNGAREMGRIRSDPGAEPRRPRASCSAVALCLIRRAPLAIGARSAPRTIAINSQTPCAPFLASAARHNQKTKRLLQSTPAKRRRRAPSRAPNRCKNLPQRITHENREPWPTPTNQLNRSRRPRRRKKKPRPRPPP